MQIRLAVLADAASLSGGILNVLGIGISSITFEELPAPAGVVLPVMIDFEHDELEVEHALRVDVMTPDGSVEPFVSAVIPANPEVDVRHRELPMSLLEVIPFDRFLLKAPGLHHVHLSVDSVATTTMSFFVTVNENTNRV